MKVKFFFGIIVNNIVVFFSLFRLSSFFINISISLLSCGY